MFLSLIKFCPITLSSGIVYRYARNGNENDLCSRLKREKRFATISLGIDAIEMILSSAIAGRVGVRPCAAPAWRLLESRATRVTSADETRLSGEFHNEQQPGSVVAAKSTKYFYVKEERKKNAMENARPR